jgi:hypothetical protein
MYTLLIRWFWFLSSKINKLAYTYVQHEFVIDQKEIMDQKGFEYIQLFTGWPLSDWQRINDVFVRNLKYWLIQKTIQVE